MFRRQIRIIDLGRGIVAEDGSCGSHFSSIVAIARRDSQSSRRFQSERDEMLTRRGPQSNYFLVIVTFFLEKTVAAAGLSSLTDFTTVPDEI
jgi:hypothetical protein